MRRLFFLTILSLLSVIVFSQKKKKGDAIPDFGKIDKADLLMKECDFDPKAEAVVLFETGELNCLLTSNSVDVGLDVHVRIKVLREEGRKFGDVHIPYFSYRKLQDVRDISAATYNLDAAGNVVITKVDKKSIYDKALNKRISEKAFSFPEVRPGSILEYKFTITNESLVNWYFQRSIPVKYSSFTVDFPKEIVVYAVPKCSHPFDRVYDEQPIRTVETYTMKNIPALRDEPYILNESDYLEKVETKLISFNLPTGVVNLVGDWRKIIREMLDDEDFGMQLKKELPRTEDLDAAVKKLKSPYEKMVTIHNYVRNNMSWNGMDNIWALEGVKAAWKDRKGTSGEINLILINLLKDAGLKAMPILVSTHDHGLVNTIDANREQFNKVLAYVMIDDDVYILDATEKETPSNLIPSNVLLNEGMVIEQLETYQWGWKTLWKENLKKRELILISASIDEKGKMTGETKLTSYDYARVKKLPYARKGVKEFTERFLSNNPAGLSIDSLEFENLQVDSLPLIQTVKFSQDVPASGEYRYFNGNLFTGIGKSPFIAEKRVSDVFFGVNQSYSIIGTIYIPDGYKVEGVPGNIRMIMPDNSITVTRMTQSDDISVYFNVTVDFNKPFYPVADYPAFREFYKKLEDLLNEQFVIRKK
jgi:hypothetical protein